MRPVDENVVSTDVWARCVTTITQECAFLQGAELDRAAPTLTCGMTDGIVRCTSMQRPRRAAWQRNGWRTVKGAICSQRAVEKPIVNYPRASSYTPSPRSPEEFWDPAHCLGGVSRWRDGRVRFDTVAIDPTRTASA